MGDAVHGPEAARVDHYFRHQYGRLVATLARVHGVHRIEAIEDAVQSALMLALTSWGPRGTPDDPGAWLYRVAHNRMLDLVRSAAVRKHAAHDEANDVEIDTNVERFEREIADDQLRMLFVCCDQAIPLESQLVLALKTLCGFSCAEIALRLFTSEANVRKRLTRARERLRELPLDIDTPSDESLAARSASVHAVIYLLFTEGYHSAQPDRVVRRELCDEAIRLATIWVQHPVGDVPATRALLALLCLQAARLDARVDAAGELLLLEEQDRSRWDPELLRRGCQWLALASEGDEFTRFHAEAGIAAEHLLAPSFADTRWGEIAALYEMLEQLAPSPLHTLHRAIAVSYQRGPDAGLAILAALDAPAWLRAYHIWDAAHGALHHRAGRMSEARAHYQQALRKASTHADRTVLKRRLAQCSD